jgi:hypothetical protein
MVTLPADTAVTTPLAETVATEVLSLLHSTALIVELEGATVAIKVAVFPTVMLVDVLFRDTPVTDTGPPPLPPLGALTLKVQVAVLPPSTVVTVITALPADTPVTTPLADTEATLEVLLLHVTDLFIAFEGDTVAISVSALPTVRLAELLFRETPVTAVLVPPPPLTAFTVTVQVAILPPLSVLTMMVALPADIPFTKPVSETVALSGETLLHITALFVALAGVTEANRFSVPPTPTDIAVLFKVTPVTGTSTSPPLAGVTETAQVDLFSPSTVIAVIAALPALMPMTTPSVTVATSGLLLVHVTSLLAASSGKTVAVRVS